MTNLDEAYTDNFCGWNMHLATWFRISQIKVKVTFAKSFTAHITCQKRVILNFVSAVLDGKLKIFPIPELHNCWLANFKFLSRYLQTVDTAFFYFYKKMFKYIFELFPVDKVDMLSFG